MHNIASDEWVYVNIFMPYCIDSKSSLENELKFTFINKLDVK